MDTTLPIISKSPAANTTPLKIPRSPQSIRVPAASFALPTTSPGAHWSYAAAERQETVIADHVRLASSELMR
jgi:hypothetical protein